MYRLPRITIAAMLGLVGLCALSFAALRASSPYWAAAMVSLTVVALLGSVVASIWGRHRAIWSGFAIFGWVYFLMTFTSPFRDIVSPHLLSSVAIVESYTHVHPEVKVEFTDLTPLPGAGLPIGTTQATVGTPMQVPSPKFVAIAGGGPRPIMTVTFGGSTPYEYVPSGPNHFYSYVCSAHAAFTLAFAGVGAVFAALVASRAAKWNSKHRP
jgi:hypothetical protein